MRSRKPALALAATLTMSLAACAHGPSAPAVSGTGDRIAGVLADVCPRPMTTAELSAVVDELERAAPGTVDATARQVERLDDEARACRSEP